MKISLLLIIFSLQMLFTQGIFPQKWGYESSASTADAVDTTDIAYKSQENTFTAENIFSDSVKFTLAVKTNNIRSLTDNSGVYLTLSDNAGRDQFFIGNVAHDESAYIRLANSTVFNFKSNRLFLGPGTTGYPNLWMAANSLTNLTYSFFADDNTGITRLGADSLGIATNGSVMAQVSTRGLYLVKDSTGVDAGSTALATVSHNCQVGKITIVNPSFATGTNFELTVNNTFLNAVPVVIAQLEMGNQVLSTLLPIINIKSLVPGTVVLQIGVTSVSFTSTFTVHYHILK